MRIGNALEDSTNIDGRGDAGDGTIGTDPVQRKLTPAPLAGYLDPAPTQALGGALGGGMQPAPPTPSMTPPVAALPPTAVDPLAFGPGWEGPAGPSVAPLSGTPMPSAAATPGWEAPDDAAPAPLSGTPAPNPASTPGWEAPPTGPAPMIAPPSTGMPGVPEGWQFDSTFDANGNAVVNPGHAGDQTGAVGARIRSADGSQVKDLSGPDAAALIHYLQSQNTSREQTALAGSASAKAALDEAQKQYYLKTYGTETAPDQSKVNPIVAAMNAAHASGDPAKIRAVVAQYSADPAQALSYLDQQPDPAQAHYLQDGQSYDSQGRPLAASDPNSYNALSDLIRQAQASGLSPGVVTGEMQKLIASNPSLAATLPKDYAAQYGNTLGSLGVQAGSSGVTLPAAAAPGTANGGSQTNAPGAPAPTQAPTSGSASASATPGGNTLAQFLGGGGAAPVPRGGSDTGGASSPSLGGYLSGTTSPAGQYASMTPTDPNNDLRSQTITPGPALDRFKLAQDQLKTFNDATNPYYEAALRDANRSAAGAGRLGSGMLRTSIGDLANQRNLQLETQGQSFLQDALSGSQDDSRANLNALLAEQQYQTNAQNQSFNQNVVGQQLQDSLTNSSFGRALSSLNAGSANDPSSMLMMLSGLYGNQASSAQDALARLISGTTANNASNASNQSLLAWLASMRNGSSGGTAPSPGGADNNPNWPYS